MDRHQLKVSRNAWHEFVLKMFYYGDPEAMRQGTDPSALRELTGSEREVAIDTLIEGLAYDDALAALGLRVMRATRAKPFLLEQLPRASDAGHVETALALRMSTDDQQYAAEIIKVLADRKTHWSQDAVIALRHFNAPAAVEALYAALTDDRFLVRYHATESLLVIHHVQPPSLNPDTELFQAITAQGRDETRRDDV